MVSDCSFFGGVSYKNPPLKPVKVCDPFCFISGISAQIIPSWATQTISAQSRISVLMFTSASTTWWAFHALYGEPTKNPQQFGDVGPFHGLRISLAILQDLFIFVQGQLVPGSDVGFPWDQWTSRLPTRLLNPGMGSHFKNTTSYETKQ